MYATTSKRYNNTSVAALRYDIYSIIKKKQPKNFIPTITSALGV